MSHSGTQLLSLLVVIVFIIVQIAIGILYTNHLNRTEGKLTNGKKGHHD